MSIQRTALLYIVVASASWAILSDAFAPSQIVRSRAPFVTLAAQSNTPLSAKSKPKRSLAGLWAKVDDQDEEEEDDDLDDEDALVDDFEQPLSKGVDSVSWLPSLVNAKKGEDISESKIARDSEILPLFPLGGIVYTPNSEHILNIFEPRYRQMYNDILMNGTKRFVVAMSHPSEKGRFAQTGVLFELEDLKEVSEQTADQIKYICNHKVTGRVKLHRVLNPEAWETRDTYLRVEGSIMDDSGKKEEKDDADVENEIYGVLSAAVMGNPKEQTALRDAFADLIDIQHDLEEAVRFTRASVVSLALKPGSGSDGLWQTIRLWQSFADQRLMSRQNELQKDFQDKLQEFLKKDRGLKDEELPR
jgi:Lon protease-like protein